MNPRLLPHKYSNVFKLGKGKLPNGRHLWEHSPDLSKCNLLLSVAGHVIRNQRKELYVFNFAAERLDFFWQRKLFPYQNTNIIEQKFFYLLKSFCNSFLCFSSFWRMLHTIQKNMAIRILGNIFTVYVRILYY